MKKRIKKSLLLGVAVAAVCAAVAGCSDAKQSLAFDCAEYTVISGDRISVENGSATYKILGETPSGVSLSENGVFAISDGVADGAQIVIAAVVDGKITSTAICTLSVPVSAPTIVFSGISDYVLDGGRIRASANGYGVTYSLKAPVDGIKIDPSAGRVSYTQIVQDGQPFTVVATSRGGSAEKTYLAAVGELIKAENTDELIEYAVGRDVEFVIDYGDMSGSGAAFAAQGVIGVAVGGTELSKEQYTYDFDARTVTIKQSVAAMLEMGENEVRIFTAKNEATATISAAKYIRTAEDLAAVNASREALGGYYALANDIDLGDYLRVETSTDDAAAQGVTKNAGGWQPIGQYSDVADSTATAMAFRGTFDGRGHKISGLWIDWTADRVDALDADGSPMLDEQGNRLKSPKPQYFNAGLFGYITSDGVVRNLVLESEPDEKAYMCSYSGGLCGVNLGTIENCLVNVDVALEADHRVAGALVGRNEGSIRNCISLGTLLAANSYGALVGVNQGDIVDCYALDAFDFESLDAQAQRDYAGRPDILDLCGEYRGNGSASESCAVYKTLDELIAQADFSAWAGWTVTAGELPEIAVRPAR